MERWDFTSGSCAVSHDFDLARRADFRNRSLSAFMEEIPVMPGIFVYRVRASGRGSFSLAKTPPFAGGRIILGCLVGGRGSWRLEAAETQDWRDGGRAYSMTPVDRSVTYEVHADDEWTCAALRLEAEAIETIGRDMKLPPLVRAGLEGRLRDHALSLPITAELRRLTAELMRPAYGGAMQALYRQAKALEFAAHHLDLLAGPDRGEAEPTSREMVRVRRARDRLIEELRDPPTLDELAASVGLSPRRLNAGFRALYGTTVFDFLRDARLDLARRMLDEGLDVPLKQLAWSVGYGQATNFVTAFRRRFGVTPGHYRRRAAEDA